MDAEIVFENLLQQVKSSKLNFKLEQSPYSAFISLKKSFLTDRNGIQINLQNSDYLDNQLIHYENLRLEKIIQSLQHDLEDSVADCANVYQENKRLESELEKSRIEKVLEDPRIPLRRLETVEDGLENKTQLFIQASQVKTNLKISADADGGPRSRVRTAGHSAQPPIDISGNFSAHVSAE